MAIWILQPDADGNCCDCTGRTEPCDSCGGCGSCTYECVSETSGFSCRPDLNGTHDYCATINATIPGCEEFPTETILQTAQVRLVLSELTPNVETTAHVYFSDNTQHDFVFTPTSDTYTTEYVSIPNPAFNDPDISVNGCSVDCECSCSLLIPPFSSPYADYTTASTALATNVFDCLLYVSGNVTTGSATFDGTTFSIGTNYALGVNALLGASLYGSIAATSGATITANYTITTDGFLIGELPPKLRLLDCSSGAMIDEDSGSGIAGTFTVTVPADGIYVIVFSAVVDSASTLNTLVNITSSAAFMVNPVIAQYADGSTTRQKEACPKMFLPPLTEATGNWYEDCASAAAVLTNPIQVSNCVGYSEGGDTFTAVGGSSLVLTSSTDFTVDPRFTMWGSINAVIGDSLSVSFILSGDHGFPVHAAALYDYTGTLIGTITTSGSFSPCPYTGRYIIRIGVGRNDGVFTDAFSGSATITSSGTMSTNQIQALYATSPLLTCAGRLNCGESCP